MERLTIRTVKGAALKFESPCKNPDEGIMRNELMKMYLVAVDRLAAYEDARVTPKEIEKLQ